MVREGIPQTGSGGAEGAVTHGAQLSPGGLEEVGLSGAKVTCSGVGGEQFFEIVGGSAMEAVVSQ